MPPNFFTHVAQDAIIRETHTPLQSLLLAMHINALPHMPKRFSRREVIRRMRRCRPANCK
jgi:hypothetical protein